MAVVTVKGTEYHIDNKLHKNWNKIKDGKLKKKDEDRVFIVDGREGCQPASSKVLMANGDWKNIEDIKEGDEILSPQENGSYIFSKITSTTSYISEENYDIIELNRNKKLLYSCSFNHIIPINKVEEHRYHMQEKRWRKWKIDYHEARELFNKSKRFKQNCTSLSAFPIERFKDRVNCDIEPYTLGYWLGDGHFMSKKNKNNYKSRSLGITTNDLEVIEEISKYYPIMYVSHKKLTTAKTYVFSLDNELSELLSKYGLEGKNSGDKFIPKEALLSDIEYRKRLLAGLIDSDGTLGKKGGYSICTKSKTLADNTKSLIYSLGGRASITKIKKGIKSIGFVGEYYNISFYLGKFKLPLQVKRKIKDINSKFFYLSPNRVSINLKKKGKEKVYGFELDSLSKLYVTDNYMVTHNTGKSVFAIQQAAYVDESILDDMSRITFTAEQTLNAIRNTRSTLEHTKAIIFDEAFKGLASRSAVSKINKTVIQALMEMRQNNLLLFIVLPSYYMLDLYPAVSRSNALIHISKDKEGQKRSFRVFNYAKKARLYDLGLKKGWNYKVYTNFKGRFSGKFPGGDEYYQKYLKAKQDALITTTETAQIVNPDAGMTKYDIKARDKLAEYHVAMQKVLDLSDQEYSDLANASKKPLTASMLTFYRGKVAKLLNT